MGDVKPKFAVIGAGHGGMAMAGHLSLKGFDVKLYNRSGERLWVLKQWGELLWRGNLKVLQR